MANNICDIAIQPSSCTYRFIPLWGLERRDVLLESGVMHCGLSEERGAFEIGRRNPDGHTVLFTRGGKGVVRSENREIRVEPGDMALLPAAVPHHYAVAQEPWATMWFHLSIDRWPMLAGEEIAVRKSVHVEEIAWLLACYYRETLHESAGSSETLWHLGESLISFLRRDLGHDSSARESGRERLMISSLIRKIDADLPHNWTLAEIAGNLFVSERTCMYLVKKHVGVTPMGLVTRLRMLRAAGLLVQTDTKISAVAEAVGYGDQFAFSTAFKRFHGCPPREFRKAMGQQGRDKA